MHPHRVATCLYGRGAIALRPLVVVSVAILVCNDWLFKRIDWFPRVLSGKLSDVCGLVALPLVLHGIIEMAARRCFSWRLTVSICIAIAIPFVLIKLDLPGHEVVNKLAAISLVPFRTLTQRDTSEPVTMASDRWDLLALIGLCGAIRYAVDLRRRGVTELKIVQQ